MNINKEDLIKKTTTALIIWLLAMPFQAAGEQEPHQYCEEGTASGIHFDDDKLVSVYRSPVSIKYNRKSINLSLIKAEMRAKGALSEFLEEQHSRTRSFSDTVDTSDGIKQLTNGEGEIIETEVSTMQKEVLIMLENTTSTARFQGLRKFEESYNQESSEVCVALGTSPELVRKARTIQKMFSDPDKIAMEKSNAKASLPPKSYHRKSKWK
jgi:hypothetical protein